MDAQDDPTPWPVKDPTRADFMYPTSEASQGILHGRAYFSQLGIVRRKPCQCTR